MKKKNMIKLYKNVGKIKQAMVEHHSIVDDEYILRDLIEKKTDVPAKDIEKMTDFILYLIENENCFVEEIENEIVKDVKKILHVKDKVLLNSNDMLSILNNDGVLINSYDDFSSYKHDIANNLKKENGEWNSHIVIPCTSNLQKNLFIEFKFLADLLTTVDKISDIDILITDIYID